MNTGVYGMHIFTKESYVYLFWYTHKTFPKFVSSVFFQIMSLAFLQGLVARSVCETCVECRRAKTKGNL